MRTFYRKCNRGKATCNCAVAVRSGDDVIVIDRCGASSSTSKYKALKMTLYLNGQLTKGTRVIAYGGGKKYEVWRLYIYQQLITFAVQKFEVLLLIDLLAYCLLKTDLCTF